MDKQEPELNEAESLVLCLVALLIQRGGDAKIQPDELRRALTYEFKLEKVGKDILLHASPMETRPE